MSNSDGDGRVAGCAALFAAALMLVVVTAAIASDCTARAWEKDAVRLGHAEYVPKGSEAVWQWKECEHCKGSEK